MKFSKLIVNFLFPTFSPVNLYLLLNLIFVGVIINFKKIMEFIISSLQADFPSTVFYSVLIILFLLISFFRVIEYLFSEKEISYEQRKHFSQIFYLVSSAIFIGAGVEAYYILSDSFVDKIQYSLILYLVLRSGFALIALSFIKEYNLHHVTADRITNVKPQLRFIILIFILSSILLIIMNLNNTALIAISITYFYVMLFVDVIHKFFPDLQSTSHV